MTPLLTLNQAKKQQRCRICGQPITVAPVKDNQLSQSDKEVKGITFNFGKEFAHTECLQAQNDMASGRDTPPQETLVHAKPVHKPQEVKHGPSLPAKEHSHGSGTGSHSHQASHPVPKKGHSPGKG